MPSSLAASPRRPRASSRARRMRSSSGVGSSPEAVKQIHDVKRIFGGKVVPTDESESRIFPDAKPVATKQKPQQPAVLGAA